MLKYKFEPGKDSESPLWVFVHGRGGDIDIMSVFGKKAPNSNAKIYVEAPLLDKDSGYVWWHPDETDSPSEDTYEELISTVEFIVKENKLSPKSKFAVGFSQGGGMISSMAVRNPTMFNSMAVLCGFVPVSVREKTAVIITDADRKKFTSFLFIHGSDDETIPYDYSFNSAKYLIDNEFAVEYLCCKGVGHKLSVRGIRKLVAWMENCSES